jgi:Leucine-rich repeat (LRR) protein
LSLDNNQLTSFDGTDLTSLTGLGLSSNQLTTLDGFIFPTSLTSLTLDSNQLTSLDVTGLSGLTELYLNGNPLTPSINNQILNQLNQNGLSGGEFYSSNGRTSASNTDYDNLVSLGWSFEGLDLITVGNRRCRYRTH